VGLGSWGEYAQFCVQWREKTLNFGNFYTFLGQKRLIFWSGMRKGAQ